MQCASGDFWRRLTVHAHVADEHDALSHWWTLHPRSISHGRPRDFAQYLDLFSSAPTIEALERDPLTLLGDASPATFTFMMAEQLRLHYLYLDAFGRCHARCRSAECRAGCYEEANHATVSLSFNVPSLVSTTYGAQWRPKLIVLLREPSIRLWVAFWSYGQYPARYGHSSDGFAYYFGNQSAAYRRCVQTNQRGRRKCALRFEAYGAAEAEVYYHCDQLIKGMYAVFLPEWIAALSQPNLLIVRTEDYLERPLKTLRRAIRHLGLRPPTADEARRMGTLRSHDELRRVSHEHGMPPAHVLEQVRSFYHPFNRALASMLDNPAFLWPTRQASSIQPHSAETA